jgi:hypothetical protein
MSGNIAGLGRGSQTLFRRVQMQRLGEFALKTVKARIAKGIGSDDSQMKALSGKTSPILSPTGRFIRQRVPYSQFKSQHGLQPKRDLYGTGVESGHMIDNFTVRSASENSVRMAITARAARVKALANEKRDPALSFSANDERAILAEAARMFKAQVEVLKREAFKSGVRNKRMS